MFGLAGLLISAHPPPYGPIGLILFAGTVIYLMRSQRLIKAAVPRPTPA